MKRDTFTLPLAFPGELIVDNFAGGGGTSTGLEAAFGRPVDIAINHDPEALAMHALNHPHTHHLCESVWDVNPVEATGNQPIGLVWLSPDCKHFSKAKGSTPVEKSIRGLAWVGMRWLALTKPRVMMLENVEEFQDWGPLLIDGDGNAKPDPKKRGKTFESFVRQIRAQGYVVDWKEMRACDNGAPTIRKRLFLQARRDGIPIEWPDQSHGNPVSAEVIAGKLLPWRTAAECIDFSHPAASIFDRKRPLVHNTQRRVAKGLWKHVLTSGKPFIVGVGGRMGQSPERSVDQPVQTITSKADSCVAQPVLTPFLVGQGGPAYSGKPVSVDAPVGTIPTTNHRAVAQPVLAPFINEHANASNQRTMAADEPLRTVCAQVKGGHFSVVSPTLAPMVMTNTTGHSGGPVDSPLATITTGGQQALVAAAITPLRGTSEAHLGSHDIEAPLSTVSAGGTHHALIAGHITKFNTGAIGSGLDEPLATITAGGTPKRPSTGITQGLVGAHLVTIGYGERAARYQCHCGETFTDKHATGTDTLAPAECPHCGECNSTLLSAAQDARTQEVTEPLGTIVAGGIKSAIVAAHLVDMGHGESTAAGAKRWSHGHRDIETPLNTITASGGTAAVAAVHLTHLTHHGERPGQTPDAPLPTITAAHRGEQVLVAACLEQANGGFYEGDGRAADAPMSTITAAGSNQRLVMAYYVKYYSSGGQDGALSTPMHTLPTKGRMGLVECQQVPVDCLAPEHRARAKQCADLLREHLPEQFPDAAEMVLVWHDGQYWVLVDITLRMLKPPELFQAQSFPKGYIIHEIPDPKLLFVNGKQVPGDPRLLPRIPLTATAQVRMCGNSVAPAQAEALARTSFKHEAQIYRRAA